ncbi:hypothetical protein UFOVP367_39 [uncultured Caudovirales phage]|uniref:Uncharacterized protein n=1 Tax=uncultured Caudovirales phage TaxID=2100421 RepID=A0A6J7WYF3_9CAUD|nr:hypothetical protein UFOVP367_39 [uncultured Caudovirales phage]
MTTNQQLTGAEMADQIAVENKIHIQALHHPDPDFFDDSDEIKNMQELIEYYLTFQCKNWGDLLADSEDSGPFISKIHSILFDAKDDELGRIRDEFNKAIKEMAKYVYNNHETNRWAKRIYDDTISNVI